MNTREDLSVKMIYHYAAQYALKRPVAINIFLPRNAPAVVEELSDVCTKHNIIDVYIWLSLRFPDLFVEREKALEMKQVAIHLIDAALESSLSQLRYNHSEKYQQIREKLQKSGDDLLPPLSSGVRELTKIEMLKVNHTYIDQNKIVDKPVRDHSATSPYDEKRKHAHPRTRDYADSGQNGKRPLLDKHVREQSSGRVNISEQRYGYQSKPRVADRHNKDDRYRGRRQPRDDHSNNNYNNSNNNSHNSNTSSTDSNGRDRYNRRQN